jgi:hypothetical protein
MNTPGTKEEALIQSLQLWEELAETGEENKHKAAFRVLGYIPFAGCPACAYAVEQAELHSDGHMCEFCPVDEWRVSEDKRLNCIDPKSPYSDWTYSGTKQDRQFAASRVCGLICNSLHAQETT